MTLYSRSDSQNFFMPNQHLDTRFDGVTIYCGHYTAYMGGSSDFELVFSHDELRVTEEYRILVSYELIPVIALEN